MTIEVSHAERIVFPERGITKGDVVAYYEAIAERSLVHLRERPLSLKRFPKGLAGAGFFQKNVPPHYPASIARLEVPRQGGVTIYPLVSTPEHLAYLANQNAIELHVPLGRAPVIARPDRLVIDLDPPPGALPLVRRAAMLVRDFLGALGIATVPVATGSKGYHVVAAITGAPDDLALTMQKLSTLLAATHPEELTTEFRIVKRKGRVFVDWLRNRPGATVVAPYSLRARGNASVATPLAWDEVATTAPDAFTLTDREALLARPDPLAELAPTPAAPLIAAVDEVFASSGLVLEHFDRFRS